jgi:hypothetical protein
MDIIYTPEKSQPLMFLDLDVEQVDYVAGMYPRGKVSALVADAGIGKGWVLVASSLSITSGIPFLPKEGVKVTTTGKVLVIDTEGRIKTFVRRIDELGGDRTYYSTPKSPLEIAIFENKEDTQLIEEILSVEEIDLVIIDSFSGFSSVDENTCAVLPCLQWLATMALKYNVAIVFTQVINKGELHSNRITTKSVRGFSGIYQWVELMWALDIPSNDKTLKRLYQIKNNVEQQDTTDYIFKLDNSVITWVNHTDLVISTKTRTKLDTRLEILNANTNLSGVEVAKLIQEKEPFTKLNTLIQWVSKERNK